MRQRHLMLAATCGLALALSACGGSATSQSASRTTVTALSTPATSSSTSNSSVIPGAASSGAPSESASSIKTSGPASAATPSSAAPRDVTKEISSLPPATLDLPPEAQQFLGQLKEQGIDPAGVEQEMLGVAVEVCQAQAQGQQPTLVTPIAGQLIEQQRTALALDAAASALEAAAKQVYCP